MRTAALLVAALAVAGCQKKSAMEKLNEGAGPPAADPVKLTATVEKNQVALGDDVVFHVKLTNSGTSKVAVNLPRLDDRSVSFRVRRPDGGVVRVTRNHANQDPRTGQIRPEAGDVRDLAPGESLDGDDVKVVAVEAGKTTYTPTYVRQGAASALLGEPIEVTVTPVDAGKPRLGVKLGTSRGDYTAVFRPDVAYNTVESFASLAKRGFFAGLTFHRIVKGFMAQGGDPQGNGGGGPGYFLPRETTRPPKLRHTRGVMSMARSTDPDSAGSQFFIMFGPNSGLDSEYTTFAEMADGEETLKKLEVVPTTPNPGMPGEVSVPTEKILIQNATLVNLQ